MGGDKALLPFLGRPLILRVMERLAPLADELLVTTNRPADFAFLTESKVFAKHPGRARLCTPRIVADLLPGRGPLGGLYTALHVASHPFVAVVACDMPFASRLLFDYERDLLLETDADVVLPSSAAGLEPLHAVYRGATCLPVIEAALAAVEWKLIGWLAKVKVRALTREETARCDPQGLAFLNLNTPEEFRAAERLASESHSYNANAAN